MTNNANPGFPQKRKRRMAREPQFADAPSATEQGAAEPTRVPQRTTKIQLVIEHLRRAEGASINALVLATGWLPHTTRAALTGLKKRGHLVVSTKLEDGTRIYRIPGTDAA